MNLKNQIQEVAIKNGVDLFGISNIDRFQEAPKGFHPRDIYDKTESVIVYAIKLPGETLFADNPVPFTHINTLAMQKMDQISFNISYELDKLGIKTVLIPTDDPYLYWDEEKHEGRAILSLRHAALMAGLGKLGKNNLLINQKYGNMVQIGALLTPEKLEADPMANYDVCPPKCNICIENCPQHALTGSTVIQKECRPVSNFRTNKGYFIKQCFMCRKKCPSTLGVKFYSAN